jgi:hypothetical protein
LLEDAAHLYITDELSADDYVLQFLAAHSGDAVSSGARERRSATTESSHVWPPPEAGDLRCRASDPAPKPV